MHLKVVGVVHPSLDPDSSDPAIRHLGTAAIKQELEWAGHLGLQACVLSLKPDIINLAHIVNQVHM